MRQGKQFRSIALAVSFAGTVAFTAILAVFPAPAAHSVWKGYRVLAVPLVFDESEIVSSLADAGIREFATESNSSIRNDSKMAPSQPFLQKKNAELDSWFIDRERGVRFLYLRDGSLLEDRIARAFSSSALSSDSFSWYLESAGKTGPLPTLLIGAYLIALCIFSTQKRTFLSTAAPFILFVSGCTDMVSYTSAVCAIYGFYLLADLLEPERTGLPRGYRPRRLRHRPFVTAPLGIALMLAISAHARGLSRFSITLALSVFLAIFVFLVSRYVSALMASTRLHPAFRPDLMHPDTLERKKTDRKSFFLAIPVPCLLVAAVFLFNSGNQPRGTNDTPSDDDLFRVLYIPSPSGYTSGNGFGADDYSSVAGMREEGCVPDLAWFLSVRWNLETAPWRRLDDEIRDPMPGTLATIVNYGSAPDAKIRAEEKNMGTFDSSFIKKAISAPVTPIEKMLIEQGRFVTVIPTRHMR